MEPVTTVMSTATSQLAFEISSIVISTVIGIIGIYLKKFLTTNEFVKKYNLYNEKTERVLTNAIMYAEAKAKTVVGTEISKRNLAISYIEKISPDIIAKEGDKIELMLDRKVEQLFQKEVQANRGIINNKDIGKAVITNIPTGENQLIYGVTGNLGPKGPEGSEQNC